MRRSVAFLSLAILGAASAQAQIIPTSASWPAPSTEFVVRIENVSTATTLKLSNGTTAPAPTAPVLWVVHTKRDPIFSLGRLDRGLGLEQLAETGDPSTLAKALEGAEGIVSVGVVNIPVGDGAPGPITPGKAFEFRFRAQAGERLSLAMMFGQSNDLFYAPSGRGIVLFDRNGFPLERDITGEFALWDAGTEKNQEPGLGEDQAPRQASPDAGTPEKKIITTVRDRYHYPKTGEVIRVTLKAVDGNQT